MNEPIIEKLDIQNKIDIEQVILIFNTSRPKFVIQHSIDEDREFFRQNILSSSIIYVLRKEKIYGFICMKKNQIEHLYIDSNIFSKGHGTSLLDYVKQKYDSLSLWVFQQNERAVNFYKKNGFEVVDKTNGENNEEKLPDYYMEWKMKKC